jgi:hypothetical protein
MNWFTVASLFLLPLWALLWPQRTFRTIPGPPISPIVGSIAPFAEHGELQTIAKWLDESDSSLIQYFVGKEPIILVKDIDLVAEVLKVSEVALRDSDLCLTRWQQKANARPGPEAVPLPPVNIAFTSGKLWYFLRMMIGPLFQPKSFFNFAPVFKKNADVLLEKYQLFACGGASADS